VEAAGRTWCPVCHAFHSPIETKQDAEGYLSRLAEFPKYWMTRTAGFPRARVQREVMRFCESIGQACSYKIGHLAWQRAQEKALKALGPEFDLKRFHEVLKEGAMP
jgi:uncharacterized protein (DUF885 family)